MSKRRKTKTHPSSELEALRQRVAELEAQLNGDVAQHLQQSPETLRAIAEFTYDWEYLIAPDQSISYMSPACERLSGYPPQAFKANPQLLIEIVHPDDRTVFEAHVQHYHGDEQLARTDSSLEIRIVRPDYSCRWIEHACTPAFDAQQQLLGRRVSNRDVTERHEIMAALQESEERYRLLVNLSPDAIFVHQQGRFVFANATGIELLGAHSPAEVLGKPIMDIVHPDYRASIVRRAQEALQHQRRVPLVTEKFIRLDGRSIDAEVVATGLQYQGAPAVLVIARDITERQRAEEARRQSDANLSAIFESTDQSFIFIDPQLRVRAFNLMANRRAAALSGQSMRIGASILDYIETEMREPFTDAFQRALRGEAVRHEQHLNSPPGFDGWFELHFTPVRASDGQITGVFFNTIDITERRQSEEALRQSEEKTRRLFSTELVAISIFDADTLEILDVNEAFEKLYGWSRAELLTMRSTDVSAEPQDTRQAVNQAMVKGDMHIPLRYHRKKNGQVFPVELFSGPFVWQGRRVFYAMIVDISERLKNEIERQRLYEQVRIDAATKAQLLREVNHRVKNNLMSILGLLLVEQRAATANHHPQTALALADTARRVRSLLAVHQLLSESHWAPMQLSDLVEQLIATELHALPTHKNIHPQIQPSDIEVSPRQASNLALVLNELITNTLKHTTGAEAQIAVSIEEDLPFIQLEYRDDGPGYPPHVLTGDYHSVGLRLVKQIVTETLRGKLTLRNDGGAVTTIRIRLEEIDRT